MSNQLEETSAQPATFKPALEVPAADLKKLRAAAKAEQEWWTLASRYSKASVLARCKGFAEALVNAPDPESFEKTLDDLLRDATIHDSPLGSRLKRFARDGADRATKSVAPIVESVWMQASELATKAADEIEEREAQEAAAAGLPHKPSATVAGYRRCSTEFARGARGNSASKTIQALGL